MHCHAVIRSTPGHGAIFNCIGTPGVPNIDYVGISIAITYNGMPFQVDQDRMTSVNLCLVIDETKAAGQRIVCYLIIAISARVASGRVKFAPTQVAIWWG